MPRALCRHDIADPDFACLPLDCKNCDPTTNEPELSPSISGKKSQRHSSLPLWSIYLFCPILVTFYKSSGMKKYIFIFAQGLGSGVPGRGKVTSVFSEI